MDKRSRDDDAGTELLERNPDDIEFRREPFGEEDGSENTLERV